MCDVVYVLLLDELRPGTESPDAARVALDEWLASEPEVVDPRRRAAVREIEQFKRDRGYG